SHRLMLRAGMIRQLSQGVYSYLPLAQRVLQKIENIVREEMNRAGALEVRMPVIQPRALWEETGRWQVYGPEMMRFKDRHEREYGLGPTHEEVITDLVRHEVNSYRDCPLNFYQIAVKFRDESRPRFGVMRAREFTMKDGYSFDMDEEKARESYKKMEQAYRRIFDRIGLEYRQVEAATGAIGGSLSHEFMVLAETGEDQVLYCPRCGYAANREQAEAEIPEEKPEAPQQVAELEKFPTPDVKTIEDLMKIDTQAVASRQVKTMVMRVCGQPTALLLPGDYQLNETKLLRAADNEVAEMSPVEIEQVFGAQPGSLGAVEVDENIRVWADPALKGRFNLFTGANENGFHYRGVSMQRDIEVDRWLDLRLVKPGDGCPHCSEPMQIQAGIEVGHIFFLGTKYSEALSAEIQLPDGSTKPLVMGCYGIGISRIMGAAIEQGNDENGIIWPEAIAPFEVYLLPVNWKNEDQKSAALELAGQLNEVGIDVLIDDRSESVGVKFAESELLGIPLRITFGRDLAEDKVELYHRSSGDTQLVELSDCKHKIMGELTGNA
ncbi:MAG: proline--tRNA ligase, partial [bacterium]